MREREIAHIFRPFSGYLGVRLVKQRNQKAGHDYSHLCFVEFETAQEASAAREHLQGYILDLAAEGSPKLNIKYARSEKGLNSPGSNNNNNKNHHHHHHHRHNNNNSNGKPQPFPKRKRQRQAPH